MFSLTRVVFFAKMEAMVEEEKKNEVNNEATEIAETKRRQNFFSRIKTKHNEKKKKKLEELEKQQLSAEENKIVEEKVEEVEKKTNETKNSKKSKIKNIIFFIFNIVLVAGILIWNIYTSDDFTPLRLRDINFLYVFIALVLLLGIIIVDMMGVHRMIYRKTLKSRWFLSYKSLAILRYYDAVTPLASGGQAFMATYLMGRDVPASTSLSIPIAKLVFQQIAWLIVTSVCLIISFVNGMSQSFVSAASIIGFILSFVMVTFILFVSLSKKTGQKLVSWGLKLLVKMHILKDYDKHYAKVMNFVQDYQNIMKEYSKAKWDVLYQIGLHVIRFLLMFSIPYFISLCFPYVPGAKIGNYGDFFVYTALIDLASSFIPLPGGTGMNEITFAALFKDYLGGYTFWGLLLWRFCSYYFYLINGLNVIAYDTIYGNRKYRWTKCKQMLQEESQEFKRAQIESFRQERNKRRKKQKKFGVFE